jgi:hypothetical protein
MKVMNCWMMPPITSTEQQRQATSYQCRSGYIIVGVQQWSLFAGSSDIEYYLLAGISGCMKL